MLYLRLNERVKLGYKEFAGGDFAAGVKALNYELWIDNLLVCKRHTTCYREIG